VGVNSSASGFSSKKLATSGFGLTFFACQSSKYVESSILIFDSKLYGAEATQVEKTAIGKEEAADNENFEGEGTVPGAFGELYGEAETRWASDLADYR
jgi:hypothetical protein